MQIFVKSSGKTFAVEASASETIEAIKAKINVEGSVFFAGALLEDDTTVEACQLTAAATVDVVVPIEGGKGKKKKKKIFTKAKKPIHRHKNIKMRVLKFYKVEGDGEDLKVTHERMECPHPKCGAGVFMAVHKNRQTCGKCSLTYVKK